MAGNAVKLATYADLLALPEDERAEIISGSIITAPAPLPKHSKAQGALRRFVGGPFDDDDGYGGPGGWWIFVEVDIQLRDHDVVRPDLSGWKRKHLPNPGEQRPISTRPDWVCEILSPSTASIDRVQKRRLYAEVGIPFYWIVDTDSRTLEAFKLLNGQWLLAGSYSDTDEAARIEPFHSIELAINRIFLPKD